VRGGTERRSKKTSIAGKGGEKILKDDRIYDKYQKILTYLGGTNEKPKTFENLERKNKGSGGVGENEKDFKELLCFLDGIKKKYKKRSGRGS